MELLSTIFVLTGFMVFLFTLIKRYSSQKKGATKLEKEMLLHQQKEEEVNRRNQIIAKVEGFWKDSKFVEPIAKWHNENVYKYIFNDGYLYEFDDIMSEKNQKIGIDEDFLCFKQLSYKRVVNPTEFMAKFDLKTL